MLSEYLRNWWLVALRGLFAVLFGVLALVWPGSALMALVILFGAFALADGIGALVLGIAARWVSVALAGIAGILVGIATFIWPNVTELALLYLIAAWALVTGFQEIAAALDLRRVMSGAWLLMFEGFLSVLLGVVLILMPGAGAVGLAWVVGIYALMAGLALIVLGFRMRSLLKVTENVVTVTTVEDPSL